MNIGIFSDLHIKIEDLEELQLVCDEIYNIFTTNKVEEVWYLGDFLHRNNPSPFEIDFLANFLKRFKNIFIRIVVAKSHESSSETISHLTHFGILTDNIQIAPKFSLTTLEGQKIYLGHFMVKESLCGFKEEKSIEDYKDYDYIFLGHQHTPQSPFHIGSVRFINFSEAKDKNKFVAIFDTNPNNTNQLQLIELKSIYPMIDLKVSEILSKEPSETPLNAPVIQKRKRGRPRKDKSSSGKIAEQNLSNPAQNQGICGLLSKLDQIDPKSKVRIVFDSFKDFANYLPYEEIYKKKFYVYKRETEFNIADSAIEASKKETLSMKQYLTKWIEEKKIEKEIANILLKEII